MVNIGPALQDEIDFVLEDLGEQDIVIAALPAPLLLAKAGVEGHEIYRFETSLIILNFFHVKFQPKLRTVQDKQIIGYRFCPSRFAKESDSKFGSGREYGTTICRTETTIQKRVDIYSIRTKTWSSEAVESNL